MTEIVAAHLERVAREIAERVDKLMDAADHLVWATEIEIQGGPRTRSFILQHRAKCRYNVEQTKKALAALTGEQNGVAAALAACARESVEGLRKLSDKATPGPWREFPFAITPSGGPSHGVIAACSEHRDPQQWAEDRDFIVACVNHVRAALERAVGEKA